MHTRNLQRSLAALLLLGVVAFATFATPNKSAAAQSDWRKGWEKLASRTVNLSTEQDEIPLTHKGRLQKLVFEVRKAPVNFKGVKVHLATGEVLDIPIRSIVKQGGRSRVIDLPGQARTVRKIVFSYESLSLKRAEVVVWGRKD